MADHTQGINGTGKYFVTYQKNDNWGPSANADLRSPFYSFGGAKCTITFWYYMYGNYMGEFTLWLKNPTSNEPVWAAEVASSKDAWVNTTIPLGEQKEGFELIFMAIHGGC